MLDSSGAPATRAKQRAFVRRLHGAVAFVTMAAVLAASPASPQRATPDATPAAPAQGAIIGGQARPAPDFQRCIDVEVGGERSFGCINQQLRREVDRVNPRLDLPPLDARSPDVRVGNVNDAAVRQQYGSNYGRSVYPYRPPPVVFAVPRR